MTTRPASDEDRRAGEGPVEAVRRAPRSSRRRTLVWLAAIVERIARPSAPPICCDVLKSPEASPWSSSSRPGRRDERQRHEHGAHAERGEDHRRQHVGDVRAVDRHLRQQQQPERREHHPDGRDRAGRRSVGANCDASPAETMIPAVNGRNASPAFERPVAEHPLDVERVEEEHREHPRRRRGTSTMFAVVSERMRKIESRTSGAFDARLDQDERDEQHGRERRRSRSSSSSVQPCCSALTIA